MHENRGVRRFAALTAGVALALILAGGFVTTTRTSDTIPTWPKSWGNFQGGWWIEWSHRAFAGTVALLVLALVVWLRLAESRVWVRRVAWATLGAVVIQALIGGLRIVTVAPVPVAIVHACFGQLVFCAMVSVALFVSEAWKRVPIDEASTGARRLGVVTTAAAFLQLVAGAVTRHTGAGMPVHLVGAGAVLLLVTLFASRLMLGPLRRGAHILMGILGLQLALGVATWAINLGGFERSHHSPLLLIVIISTHVAVGAALLATTLGVTLMCHRGAVAVSSPIQAVHA